MGLVWNLVCKWCDLPYYVKLSTAMDPETYCCTECEEDDPEGT